MLMKVLIFYKRDSEHGRLIDEFVHDFNKQYPESELTILDADSIDGSHQAEIYDVVQYPTVIATTDEGGTLQRWDTGQLPLMSEVAYYANQ
jgi:methyl coenzyme M reductase alpha subunit